MKKSLTAIALALGIASLTFAQTTPPAEKTPAEEGAKKTKKGKKDRKAKKAEKTSVVAPSTASPTK